MWLSLSIVGTNELASFTEYVIEASLGATKWSVHRRYTEFEALRTQLIRAIADADTDTLVAMPPKVPGFMLKGERLKEREKGLNEFVKSCAETTAVHTVPCMLSFLGLTRPIPVPLAVQTQTTEGEGILSWDARVVHNIHVTRSGLGLTHIPLAIVTSNFAKSVSCLDLSHNNIRRLDGLSNVPNVQTLILDNNMLQNDRLNLPHLEKLSTLWLNNNHITDLDAFLSQARDHCPNLSFLSLINNPAAGSSVFSDPDDPKVQRYRTRVVAFIPTLKFLDSRDITPEERERGVVLCANDYEEKDALNSGESVALRAVGSMGGNSDSKMSQLSTPTAVLGTPGPGPKASPASSSRSSPLPPLHSTTAATSTKDDHSDSSKAVHGAKRESAESFPSLPPSPPPVASAFNFDSNGVLPDDNFTSPISPTPESWMKPRGAGGEEMAMPITTNSGNVTPPPEPELEPIADASPDVRRKREEEAIRAQNQRDAEAEAARVAALAEEQRVSAAREEALQRAEHELAELEAARAQEAEAQRELDARLAMISQQTQERQEQLEARQQAQAAAEKARLAAAKQKSSTAAPPTLYRVARRSPALGAKRVSPSISPAVVGQGAATAEATGTLSMNDLNLSASASPPVANPSPVVANITTTVGSSESSPEVVSESTSTSSAAPVTSTWVADAQARSCSRCTAPFKATRRRHHCRRCGNVFCDSCSSQRRALPDQGHPTPVRVCSQCAQELTRETPATQNGAEATGVSGVSAGVPSNDGSASTPSPPIASRFRSMLSLRSSVAKNSGDSVSTPVVSPEESEIVDEMQDQRRTLLLSLNLVTKRLIADACTRKVSSPENAVQILEVLLGVLDHGLIKKEERVDSFWDIAWPMLSETAGARAASEGRAGGNDRLSRWLRASLCAKSVAVDLESVVAHPDVLRMNYAEGALLLDDEDQMRLTTMLHGLGAIEFVPSLWANTESGINIAGAGAGAGGDSKLVNKDLSTSPQVGSNDNSVGLEEFSKRLNMSEHVRTNLAARHDVDLWKIDFHQITIGDLIGRGGFGEVYRGVWRGTDVAVKKLLDQNVDEKTLEAFCDEVNLMRQLRHPNIVLFMGASLTPGCLGIVTEFLPKLSLFTVLHDPLVPLSQTTRRSMALHIARGMAYLHGNEPPVLHLDLKSLNLLVDDNFAVKVADFGLSTFKRQACGGAAQAMGTVHWMAPEYMAYGEFDEKSDVYSFAICLWELSTRQTPYPGHDANDLAQLVIHQGLRPTIPRDCLPVFSKVMTSCWAADSDARPHFTEILTMLAQQ